jgi:histidinol dehydrogenase
MRTLRYTDPEFASEVAALNRRATQDQSVEQTVREIIAAVRAGGDDALVQLGAKFGGPLLSPETLAVTDPGDADEATARAIAASRENVLAFAKAGLRQSWSMTNAQGAFVGERFDPFQRVGIYVPGGTAPLVSTAVMTVTLAAAAGVPEIVVTTPPAADGYVHPALAHALHVCGATEVYRVGGAQAIAALAYGTPTIRSVQKVFGPGNRYVVEAKRQVFGQVAVDLLPGPSEILVIADDSANPDWVAADLLAQAEHGHGSAILLITDSEALLAAVLVALESQAATLQRQQYLKEVLLLNSTAVLVASMADAVTVANAFAAEHVSLTARDEQALSERLTSSGAIFLGGWSPVAVGDFAAGPSHTLPTGGAGKSFPGLMSDMFQRRTSIVRLDRASLEKSVPIVEAFSRAEGLDAHGRSATIRFSA